MEYVPRGVGQHPAPALALPLGRITPIPLKWTSKLPGSRLRGSVLLRECRSSSDLPAAGFWLTFGLPVHRKFDRKIVWRGRRQVAPALIALGRGEQTAQAYAIACSQHLSVIQGAIPKVAGNRDCGGVSA